MNYAKIIDSALKLFPKKIKVTLIDAATGNRFGKYKVLIEQLPAAFNKPTILQVNNVNWKVFKADPVLANDFFYSKRLVLHVQEAGKASVQSLGHIVPTISELPRINTSSLNNNFTIELTDTDWHQTEFSLFAELSVIEEEIKVINKILTSQLQPLLGYEQQYVRKIRNTSLDIPFDHFCQLMNVIEKGHVYINEYGFVQNGFAARTNNYTYYGTLENGHIYALSLTQFECIDDELMLLLTSFQLVLCDWCHAHILSITSTEDMTVEEAVQI